MLLKIASLRLTAIGIGLVIATTFIGNRYPDIGFSWTALPFGLLSLNLIAALITNRAFRRQSALMVFHVCLLAVFVIAGLGVLTGFEGHVELVEGEQFHHETVETTRAGIWHRPGLQELRFSQGDIEVNYAPGLVRQSTRSMLFGDSSELAGIAVIGDRAAAVIDDYRFSTSFNKGYAVILRWTDESGDTQFGSINFPSYPEYEWKQVNDWVAPGGEHLALELKLTDQAPRHDAWTLVSGATSYAVEITGHGITRNLLREGDSVALSGGTLRIEDLRLWMGYRIDCNPLLPWLFAAAILALIALALHFQAKFWPARRTAGLQKQGGIATYDA